MARAIRSLKTMFLAMVAVLCGTYTLSFAAPAQGSVNLLQGRSPSNESGVSNVGVINDGSRAGDGEDWNISTAARFESPQSFVEYDLGKSTPIVAAYLQGDNNDEYLVTVSEDGKTFTPLWTAERVSLPGLRQRWIDGLAGQGRYVRLAVNGGDRAYSVTEFQVFAGPPDELPPPLPLAFGENLPSRVRTSLLYLVAAFAVLLGTTHAGSRVIGLGLSGLVALAGLAFAYHSLTIAWPLEGREISMLRAVAGAIALLAIMRRSVLRKRFPAHRTIVTLSLAFTALTAFACFYNLGRPQFFDQGAGRPLFVHTDDMRVYQPFAKYFRELQYDGVYDASVLAYAENHNAGSLDAVAQLELRSLRDHRVRRVSEAFDEIHAVRARFSDARWREFKKDSNYFQRAMGNAYIATLLDHGANATPVWVFFARVMLGSASASDSTLSFSGLADGLLLLLMAVSFWRSFGLLPALLAMTVFGATDLYMFGTNWGGATLRHDWLALLGFAASALKKERWLLGGACVGLAATIRAFPAAALFGIALPLVWEVGARCVRERKPPRLQELLDEHRIAIRVLLGAAACMLSAFLITGVLYSFSSWGHWWDKVTLLNEDVGANEVSLRALLAGADRFSPPAVHSRRILLVLAQLGCFALVTVLARRRPPHQALVLGLPLALVIWNPSNYYSHFVFLLALLGSSTVKQKPPTAETRPSQFIPFGVPLQAVGLPLLVLCVAGYWAALDPDVERHFQESTALLFASLAWLYANLSRRAASVTAPAG